MDTTVAKILSLVRLYGDQVSALNRLPPNSPDGGKQFDASLETYRAIKDAIRALARGDTPAV